MEILPTGIDKYITPKTTGYAAAAAVGLSAISGKNKVLKKCHKPFAYSSVALIAIHIGLIEYNHYKWKKFNS